MNRAVLQPIVDQHAGDAAVIYRSRTWLSAAPHASLRHLHRFDVRLAAHLDGLREAGAAGRRSAQAALESPSPAALFIATVRAIEDRDASSIDRLFAVAEALPAVGCGLRGAFGWMTPGDLQDLLPSLAGSSQSVRRHAAVAAYAMHRVGPDSPLFKRGPDSDAAVLARTLRWAGEVGASEYVSAFWPSGFPDEPQCSFWAAWANVLLGDRGRAQAALRRFVSTGPHRRRALQLALQAAGVEEGSTLLRALVRNPEDERMVIHGTGVLGTIDYVPWLLSRMKADTTARIAGEAFSLVSGVDLALADLERTAPENFQAGPNDNPEDPNVEMDPDEGLPWPDVERVEKWWAANSARFHPGIRYFMGQPVTREHCIHVLKTGYQRQRILAAHYLCLLDPGTPLFNTSAPAWRQQRLLAQM
jgi:uncharacterized protein (TIGR02270 family)